MEKQLEEVAQIVNEYKKMKVMDGNRLNYLIKDLSALLYYLETKRSEYHNDFESHINHHIIHGESVSRATNLAHQAVPEMYQLRRLLSAGWNVADAIRTNLSYIKHEENHSN